MVVAPVNGRNAIAGTLGAVLRAQNSAIAATSVVVDAEIHTYALGAAARSVDNGAVQRRRP